ncbi:MAG TPA: hypothetical protein PLO78_09395 [Candidatus Omnitrophota bacterium]|nr:hypothetical protein [Candidatus Omnitrophota bacterium]
MKIIKLLFTAFFFVLFFQGCVRVAGTAGYWHQGAEDAEPKVKQVGFDTQNLIPAAPPSADIKI